MDRSTRLPTPAEIAEISAKHLIETELRPADLLFMFGTREDEALRAETAARLWRAGYFRRAIVSGGMTPGAAQSECTIIKAAMVAAGIPADAILEEHRALNTGENVIFSLPVIEAALGLKTIRSVICLGNTWTARRYPMTLHLHWPGGRENAGHRRQFCNAARTLAHPRRIAPPYPARMGQDRAVQGERIHCGMA